MLKENRTITLLESAAKRNYRKPFTVPLPLLWGMITSQLSLQDDNIFPFPLKKSYLIESLLEGNLNQQEQEGLADE